MEKISKKTLLKIMTQKNNKKGKKIIKRRIKRNIRVKQKKTFNKAPFFVKSVLIILLTFTIIYLFYSREKFSLKVGVVGVRYIVNIGNNLLRYAISVKLKELGYKPYIIGILYERLNNIELIKRTTNVVIIKKSSMKYNWMIMIF